MSSAGYRIPKVLGQIKMRLLLLLSRFSHVRLCATPQMAATRLPQPWDSPGKNTGVGCHFLLQCMKVKSENEVPKEWQNKTGASLRDHSPLGCSPGARPLLSVQHGPHHAYLLFWVPCPHECHHRNPTAGAKNVGPIPDFSLPHSWHPALWSVLRSCPSEQLHTCPLFLISLCTRVL